MLKYSQNSPLWKYDKMGKSNSTLGRYGCLTTSICTLGSYFGEDILPKTMAQKNNLYTSGGLLIWSQLDNVLKNLKFVMRIKQFNERAIDEALLKNPNTCVVLNVDRGYHWVAALKKGFNSYVCSDPYPYPARNRTYKFSDICGFAVLANK
jgi:hypothetical protein